MVTREFVFNGLRYRIGLPVSTEAEFTTWRFGYEYDFIYRGPRISRLPDGPEVHERGRAARQPNRRGVHRAGGADSRLRHGRARLRASQRVDHRRVELLQSAGRAQPTSSAASYLDYNFYGMVNFNGTSAHELAGGRIDVDYFKDLDSGNLNFGGWYFGGVV